MNVPLAAGASILVHLTPAAGVGAVIGVGPGLFGGVINGASIRIDIDAAFDRK